MPTGTPPDPPSAAVVHHSIAALWAPDAADVVLVRHGEALGDGSVAGAGYRTQPLTSTGRAQAHAAARWVARYSPVDAVLASPLLRCRQTAEPLATGCDADVRIDDRLAELRTPMDDDVDADSPESTVTALRAAAMALAAAVGPDGRLVPVPGVEDRRAFVDRVTAVLLGVGSTYSGRRVAVVSHGLWCAMAIGLAAGAATDVPVMVNLAGISVLRVTPDGGAVLVTANSVAHLHEAGLPVAII